jgi:hypothetical protein
MRSSDSSSWSESFEGDESRRLSEPIVGNDEAKVLSEPFGFDEEPMKAQ